MDRANNFNAMHINQNEMRYEDDIQIWTTLYTKQVVDFKLWNWASGPHALMFT